MGARPTMLVAPSAFDGLAGLHMFAHDGMGHQMILSEPRIPDRAPPWRVVLERERARAVAMPGDRGRVSLSALEDALVSAAADSGRALERDLEVSPARRVHRLAGLLGCGLLLFVDSDS